MTDLLIAGGCLALVLSLLGMERLAIDRSRAGIPLRIAVTGTRGKTSVVRLIAAGLREDGLRVLAKTTGSEARVILPDGTEEPVRRRGVPTPLEQRGVLRSAARLACDAIVIEAMSIRPESLRAELGQIVRPHTVVVTNTFEDHWAEMANPAAVFSDAVPVGATALLPRGFPDSEQARLTKRNIPHRVISEESANDLTSRVPHPEWPQNLALALAACDRAGVAPEIALRGMAQVHMDVGVLGAWILRDPGSAVVWTAINGFAANDPRSAQMALQRALVEWPKAGGCVIGLLNLRSDRADRTAQWMNGLSAFGDTVDGLVVCGSVPRIVRRGLARMYGKRSSVVASNDPERIMDSVTRLCPEGGHVFGCGNIGGAGIRLVEYWQGKGDPA